MMCIPKHIESETRNDIKRRFGVQWSDVLTILATPPFAFEPESTGIEIRRAIYRAADEVLRRESLA